MKSFIYLRVELIIMGSYESSQIPTTVRQNRPKTQKQLEPRGVDQLRLSAPRRELLEYLYIYVLHSQQKNYYLEEQMSLIVSRAERQRTNRTC
jgi:hypothetical protein